MKSLRQKGFSIIELLIVVSIVFVGLLAILGYLFREANTTHTVNAFLEKEMKIEQSIRDQYKTQLDYSNLSYAQLLAEGIIPPDLLSQPTYGQTTWGLPLYIAPAGATPSGTDLGDTVSFDITLPDLPTCIAVSNALAPRSTWMLINHQGGTVVTLPGSSTNVRTPAADISAAIAACTKTFASTRQSDVIYATQ